MKEKNTRTHYIIAGPTGSGKSAHAMNLAQEIGGTIINADSLQVYKDLPILTAQPSPQEMEMASHCLYGFLGPEDSYSAQKWAETAEKEIEAAQGPVLLVGGTGFYFKALLEGLSPIPDISEEIQQRVRGLDSLQVRTLLEELDPLMAERLHPHDLQRNARALEVMLETGKSLSHWQSLKPTPSPYPFHKIGVFPEKEVHQKALHNRILKMWDQGVVDEVQMLISKGLSQNAPIKKAIGFFEIESYLSGTLTKDSAQELMLIKTRQYAKRQRTWFRHQMRFDAVYSSSL